MIRAAGRDDLESFASAHGLREKMARTRERRAAVLAAMAGVVGVPNATPSMSLVSNPRWLAETG